MKLALILAVTGLVMVLQTGFLRHVHGGGLMGVEPRRDAQARHRASRDAPARHRARVRRGDRRGTRHVRRPCACARGAWRREPPRHRGAVLAITHFGYLEFAIVEWITFLHNRRHIRFMAKKAAFKGWPLGALMRGMKHFPVDRAAGAGAFDEAIAALGAAS